jgi:RNA polymerase sigma factor for flagellar operon FliA
MNQEKQRLAVIIDALPENERLFVALYYYERLSLDEIGNILKIPKSRVTLMHIRFLEIMQGIGTL